MSQLTESWHHYWTVSSDSCHLQKWSALSFLSQLIHSSLQLIVLSLTRVLLSCISHDVSSPEMPAWNPSLCSDSALSAWYRIAFLACCIPLLSGLPAQWPLSAGSATSRHAHAENCRVELQNGKNEAGSCISCACSASLSATPGVNLL